MHPDVAFFKKNSRELSSYHNKANSCVQRGISFDLSFAEWCELRSVTHCQLTGVKLVHAGCQVANSHSIDRVDSSKGYTMANCMVISFAANQEKERLDSFMKGKVLSTEAKLKLLYKMEYVLRKQVKETN